MVGCDTNHDGIDLYSIVVLVVIVCVFIGVAAIIGIHSRNAGIESAKRNEFLATHCHIVAQEDGKPTGFFGYVEPRATFVCDDGVTYTITGRYVPE